MEIQNEDKVTDPEVVEPTVPIDELTAHFRRTSRVRIVELPRWAQ